MGRRTTNLNRNITRIDTSTRGYEVRVMRGGQSFCRLFSDSIYGGKRKALKAAREYRDELIEELSELEISRRQRAEIKSRRNTSGLVGVRYVEETTRKGDYEYVYGYWEAQWSPRPGERRKRRFSVSKYGDRKAKKLAREARKNGVAEMVD